MAALNDILTTIDTALDLIASTMTGVFKPHGIPAGAATLQEHNTTAVDSVTPRQVAAAAAADESHYISQVTIHNPTGAEAPVITLQDGSANELDRIAAGANSVVTKTYDPPLVVGTAEALNAKADDDLGDSIVFVNGWTG